MYRITPIIIDHEYPARNKIPSFQFVLGYHLKVYIACKVTLENSVVEFYSLRMLHDYITCPLFPPLGKLLQFVRYYDWLSDLQILY